MIQKKITRKRPADGDIIELCIDGLGYIYFKYIDILKFRPVSSNQYLIKVYKKIFLSPIEDINLIERELLLPPMAIAGANELMKVLKTRIVANEEIYEDDKILPDVKSGNPIFAYGFDEEKYESWTVLKNLGDTRDTFFTTIEKVKHLQWAGAIHVGAIPFRIKLEIFKLKNKDIKTELGLNEWIEEHIYEMCFNASIY